MYVATRLGNIQRITTYYVIVTLDIFDQLLLPSPL